MSDHTDALRRLQQLVDRHGSQKATAYALGISASHLNDLLRGRRTFSARFLHKIGLRRIVVADGRRPRAKKHR